VELIGLSERDVRLKVRPGVIRNLTMLWEHRSCESLRELCLFARKRGRWYLLRQKGEEVMEHVEYIK
jgi:hypothetical protein